MILRELLESCNANPPDVDLYHWDVDGDAATMVALSLKDFTEEGLAEFADVLGADVAQVKMDACGTTAVHVRGCKSSRVYALCRAHAGDCSVKDYRRWFTMDRICENCRYIGGPDTAEKPEDMIYYCVHPNKRIIRPRTCHESSCGLFELRG